MPASPSTATGPAAAAATEQAMCAGADVVYQAVLVDTTGWRRIADFLERQTDLSYEVADTKLARSAKPYFLLQLAFYSEQVGRIQGGLPDRMHVVLGTNERASYRVRDFDASTGASAAAFSTGSPTRRKPTRTHCLVAKHDPERVAA